MSIASTWRLREVAQAAEMKPRALRQAFEIGALELGGNDKKSSGSGSYIGLSRPRAYQATIMKHLHEAGLRIPDAARLAFEFSDVGNIGRAPGQLYPHGKTVLIVFGPDNAVVRNVFSDTSLADVFTSSPCVIIVTVNAIVDQVDTVLNQISRKQHD
jgi:hypothetical protein